MNTLDAMANINAVSFKGKKEDKFEIGLSLVELERRTHKDHLTTREMLKPNSVEYTTLADGDKKALKHLVKAAKQFDTVYMKQDNPKNLRFKKYLENEAKKGSKEAELTLTLFNAMKGMSGIDTETNMVHLDKNHRTTEQKGIYPEDLSKEEFHKTLLTMLDNGEKNEVADILNQRTVVQRDGKKLKAVPYPEAYKEEFTIIADELDKASEVSTNKDFNEYLKLQAKALRTEDKMLDAVADKKWAELQDTPLEFSITRENYEDTFTDSVREHEELNKRLENEGIEIIPKDFLGGRVGIINKKGTEDLLQIKDYLPMLAKNMPYADEYEQNIDNDNKQTMVDADLVALTGDCGAWRGGITLAENLPNDDKSTFIIGGGRRNVYHRQIRLGSGADAQQKKLDAILDKSQHKYYDDNADHLFTIGHENVHSLGPTGNEKLGKYTSIIEENKADMGSIAFLNLLEDKGMYDKKTKEEIIVTYCTDNFLKSKPKMNQAHRVRSVMQNKYFIDHGAIEVNKEGKIKVNIDKVVPTARKMLDEIIDVQKSKDFNKAERYVMRNFVWTEDMQKVADNLKRVNKTLNGKVNNELANKLLEE